MSECEAEGVEPEKRYLTKEPKEAKQPKEGKAKKEPKGKQAKQGKAAAAEEEAKEEGGDENEDEEGPAECPEGMTQEDFDMVLECQAVFTEADWLKMNPDQKSFFEMEEDEKVQMFATWRAHLKLRKEEAGADEAGGDEASGDEASGEQLVEDEDE